MGKRLLSVLLALCLALVCAPAPALAVSWDAGPGAELRPQSKQDCVSYPVTGGSIYFNPDTGKIEDCDTSVTRADIPAAIRGAAVTGVGNEAFRWCSKLTSVTLPKGVTSIGNDAFYQCYALASVTLPTSLTSIGNYAFYQCYALTSVTLPTSLTSIGNCAFCGCSKLTSITLPNSLTSIGDSAFSGCSSLTGSITIPDRVTSIGNSAFSGCSKLNSITLPTSLTSIGDSAFKNCSALTSMTIPYRVASIGGSVFSGCSKLTGIDLPNSLTSIGSSAFSDCSSLTSMTIPYRVASIGNSAFYGCSKLTGIDLPNSLTSIGSYAFRSCSALTSITIPQGVTSIEYETFEYCSKLTSVTIPRSVTSIKNYAFSGCSSLADVYYGGNRDQWKQIDIYSSYGSNDCLFAATLHCTCTVTFTGGPDATGTPPPQADIAEGETFTLPENTFEREGYTFAGWNDGEKTYQPGDTYTMPIKNVTFTAQWKVRTCTVTFTGGPDATGDAPPRADIAKGTTFTLPENTFEREGYTFAGWNDGEKTYQPGDTYIMPDRDVIFTAKWRDNSAPAAYTVTFTGGADATGDAPTQEATAEGGTFTLPENTFQREGYTFAGWNDGEKTYQPGDIYTMPGKDVTFTAQWTVTTCTVTFNSNGGSEVGPAAVTWNTAVEAPADPVRAGHTFTGWYTDEACTEAYDFDTPVTGDLTLYAGWRVTTYTVTFTGGADDAAGAAPTQADTAEGGTFKLPENTFEREGYTFAGWNDGKKTYQPGDTYTMPAKNVTFTAEWTEDAGPDPIDPDPDDPYPDDPDPVDPDPDDPDPDDPDPDDPDPVDPGPVDPIPIVPDPQPETPWVNPFTDVEEDSWYIGAVEFVSKNNLMNGVGDGSFAPKGDVTIAEAITMAARINRISCFGTEDFVQSGEWYQVYLDYAYYHGIIGENYYTCDVTQKATRAQFAEILARSFVGSGDGYSLRAINDIEDDEIPDVKMTESYAESVYTLYRAGVLKGSDEQGTFHPDSFITRAEAATILARMIDSSMREKFSL